MSPASDLAVAQSMTALARLLTWAAAGLLAWGLANWTMAQPWFALTTLDVATPVAHVTEAQLRLVAERTIRGTFFTVDLEHVRSSLEKLPWVAEARVERRWPDTLVVTLTEHRPVARWNDGALVNADGVVFVAAFSGDLPRYSGPEERAAEVVAMAEKFERALAPTRQAIRELDLSPRSAWAMTLGNGTRIELGRSDTEARLTRFVVFYPRLFADAARAPRSIDLRYPDGFAVRTAPDQTLFPPPQLAAVTPALPPSSTP